MKVEQLVEEAQVVIVNPGHHRGIIAAIVAATGVGFAGGTGDVVSAAGASRCNTDARAIGLRLIAVTSATALICMRVTLLEGGDIAVFAASGAAWIRKVKLL